MPLERALGIILLITAITTGEYYVVNSINDLNGK